MPRNPPRVPQSGSLQAAANRIHRILEHEEREQARMRQAPSPESENGADLLKASFPVGSTGWAAQRIQQILDREEQIQPAAGTPVRTLVTTNADQDDGYSYLDLAWDIARHARHRDPWEIPDAIQTEYEDYVGAGAAQSEMVGSQLPGRERGPANAYRHILLAAELTRRFGETRARQLLDLHEREGNLRGQPGDEYAMDLNNNEIGIRIGTFARTFNDVTSAARKAISGSAPDGSGAWKPSYDPASTVAPHAARWLPEMRWRNNPKFDPPAKLTEMRTEQTNWYSNPNRPSGPDWVGGYIPDGYSYPYPGPQHATGPEDSMARRAVDAYRLYVENPVLRWLWRGRD